MGAYPSVSGLSIVVPTYRRPTDTVELVESIRSSYALFDDVNWSPDVGLECLVCLKRTDEETASALADVDWEPLTIVGTDCRYASYNRDVGFERAEHDYVVSVDSDCVVTPDWIESIVRAIEEYDRPAAIQGNYYVDYLPETNWVTRAERRADRSRFESGQMDSRNLVIRFDTYREIGGYDTKSHYAEAAEDLILRDRIESVGGEVYMDERIQVQHKYPTGLWENLRRYKRYGQGSLHVERRNPKLYREQFSARAQCRSAFRKVWDGLTDSSRYDSGEIAYEVAKTASFTLGYLQARRDGPTQRE